MAPPDARIQVNYQNNYKFIQLVGVYFSGVQEEFRKHGRTPYGNRDAECTEKLCGAGMEQAGAQTALCPNEDLPLECAPGRAQPATGGFKKFLQYRQPERGRCRGHIAW